MLHKQTHILVSMEFNPFMKCEKADDVLPLCPQEIRDTGSGDWSCRCAYRELKEVE